MRKVIVVLAVLVATGAWASKQDYPSRVDTGYVAPGKTWLIQPGALFPVSKVSPDTIIGDTASLTRATVGRLHTTGRTDLGDAAGDTTISKKTRAVSLHVGGTTDPDSTLQVTGGLHGTQGGKIDGALNVGGTATLNGNTNLGDATTDTVITTGPLSSGGAAGKVRFNNSKTNGEIAFYTDSTYGYIHRINATGVLEIQSQTLAATDLQLNRLGGNVVFGSATGDLLPAADNQSNIGSVAATVDTGFFQYLNTYGGLRLLNAAGDTTYWFYGAGGRWTPNPDNMRSIGSTAATADSFYFHHGAALGDMPFLDDSSDVAQLRAIKPSGKVDPETGMMLVDDLTMPKVIMVTQLHDGIDTVVTHRDTIEVAGKAVVRADTVLVPYKKGDLVLNKEGKGFISIVPAIGQLQGAVRELAATDDSLRAATNDESFGGVPIGQVVAGLVVAVAGLTAWNATQKKQINDLEARIAKLEGKDPSPPNPDAA